MLFPGITPENCELAVEICLPALAKSHNKGMANKYAGTVVIIDPYMPAPSLNPTAITDGQVERAAILIQDIDPDHPDAAKYRHIAIGKAKVLWVLRTMGMMGHTFTTREVQQQFPHLFRPGMTKWHGGYCWHGLIVTFSGVQGNYDEWVSLMIAEAITAMSREAMTDTEVGVMANVGQSFIGSSFNSIARTALAAAQRAETSDASSGAWPVPD